MRVQDLARGKWEFILPLCGVEEKYLSNRHGPCPMCVGKDRWRFDNKEGRGTWFCSNCGAGDGFKLVELVQKEGFREAADRVGNLLGCINRDPVSPKPEAKAGDNIEKIRKVWNLGARITPGTVAGRYLLNRTGLADFPADLRAASSLPYWRGEGAEPTKHPALLALVRDKDGNPVNVHRTYLSAPGRKADVETVRKLMSGKLPNGSAIRLGVVKDTLGIAEGVETALSASTLFQMPVWAAVSAGNLSAWSPPSGVKRVVVFGDNDENLTGHKASHSLAARLASEGIIPDVRIPKATGQDWNDVLRLRMDERGVAA